MNCRLAVTALLLVVLTAAPALAGQLSVGSPAPALTVTEWVKGSPVDLAAAKGTHVVVVEFWATWCGPCAASAPHLTKLQQQYADQGVIIVGVTKHDENNTLEKVREYVAQHSDRMGFRIAFDKEGDSSKAFMEAADQRGIPTVFVVDKTGRIAWIGGPLSGLDDVLAEVVSGDYDIKVAKRVFELESEAQEALMDGRFDDALAKYDEIIAVKPTHAAAWDNKLFLLTGPLDQPDQALATANQALEVLRGNAGFLAYAAAELVGTGDPRFHEVAAKAVARAAQVAPDEAEVRSAQFVVLAGTGKEEEALRLADETLKLLKDDPLALAEFAHTLSSPNPEDVCNDLALRSVELAVAAEPDEPEHIASKFQILAACKQDHAAAEKVGRYFIEKASNDPDVLNSFAWPLLTEEPLAGKYNTLALAAAERANQVSGGKNWMILDTLALAKFETGAAAEAIELEKKAIELCTNPRALPSLTEALDRYQGTAQETK